MDSALPLSGIRIRGVFVFIFGELLRIGDGPFQELTLPTLFQAGRRIVTF